MDKLRVLFHKGATKLGAVMGLALVAGASMAQAAPIDVTGVTDTLTAVGVAVATIGVAVLSVIFGAKAYKWIRSAG